jgi:hypothetical protein
MRVRAVVEPSDTMAPNDEVERRGVHQRRTKTLYPNHRPPPWLNEDDPRRPLEP